MCFAPVIGKSLFPINHKTMPLAKMLFTVALTFGLVAKQVMR